MDACLDPALSALALGSPEAEPDQASPGTPGPAAGRGHGPATRPAGAAVRLGRRLDRAAARAWSPGCRRRTMSASPSSSPLRSALNGSSLPPPHERWEAAVPMPARVRDLPDGRQTLRQSVATLATLLDRRIEAVDIGHSGGVRTLAYPTGVVGHLVSADAALVPAEALDDPAPGGGDRPLERHPFRSLLARRPAAQPAAVALARPGGGRRPAASGGPPGGPRRGSTGSGVMPTRSSAAPSADMLICAGGAFAAVPPPAAAMAVVDGMRRPGALTLFHDHARLLGPIGALPDDWRPAAPAGRPAR